MIGLRRVASAVIIAAAISGTFVLVGSPQGRSYTLHLLRPSPPIQRKTPQVFASLSVIDDTRHVLNFEEQKALFEYFAEHTRDPTSVQVRHLWKTARYSFCGEANAKNGFGAYTGFLPFFGVVAPGQATYLLVVDRELVEGAPDKVRELLDKWGCP